jgi:exopolysaccharide biosynthesis WecB/TagA/CpsF family protein
MKPSGIFLATWLNHYSIQIVSQNRIRLSQFQFIGIDGQFLKYFSGIACQTTSADRVLPILLKNKIKVALIGGEADKVSERLKNFQVKFPMVRICLNANGFFSQVEETRFLNDIFSEKINLIILGLGTPLQESLALRIRDRYFSEKQNFPLVVATCGGWLDQILINNYYPIWSYRFRLNWAIRLFREPKRLWRRYTIDAIKFCLYRKRFRALMIQLF